MSSLAPWLAVLCLAGCERLNPNWCNDPGRCPAGTTCDPLTNTCLSAVHDRGTDHANPDRHRDDRAPADTTRRDLPPACVGGWGCASGAAGLCREAGLSPQRNCPAATCVAGHCAIPSSPKACTTNSVCPQAPQLWICTWLLEGSKTLRQVCAPMVVGLEGPAACTSGLDCVTGLCTSEGRCYHACDGSCPGTASCEDTQINIEGVEKSVKSCLPP